MTLLMWLYVDCLWTLVCLVKRSKLTVSLKPLLNNTAIAIQIYLLRKASVQFFAYYITSNCLLIDSPYILAFSLIMLHTDAFNKSNKHKMTKADYLRNTRLPGVAPEVLDVSSMYSTG
jgi:hypothetical protein